MDLQQTTSCISPNVVVIYNGVSKKLGSTRLETEHLKNFELLQFINIYFFRSSCSQS